MSDERPMTTKELITEIEQLKGLLSEACTALINADSELSAYGHGRPLTKEVALEVSDLCRGAYERAREVGGEM